MRFDWCLSDIQQESHSKRFDAVRGRGLKGVGPSCRLIYARVYCEYVSISVTPMSNLKPRLLTPYMRGFMLWLA